MTVIGDALELALNFDLKKLSAEISISGLVSLLCSHGISIAAPIIITGVAAPSVIKQINEATLHMVDEGNLMKNLIFGASRTYAFLMLSNWFRGTAYTYNLLPDKGIVFSKQEFSSIKYDGTELVLLSGMHFFWRFLGAQNNINFISHMGSVILGFSSYKLLNYIYLTSKDAAKEQIWVYNNILCNIHHTNPTYVLDEKTRSSILVFIKDNISDGTDELLSKIDRAFAVSKEIDWLIKIIEKLSTSDLSKTEKEQFFDFILEIRTQNKLTFDKESTMTNLLDAISELFKIFEKPEEREAHLDSFKQMHDLSLSPKNQIFDYLKTSGLNDIEKKEFFNAITTMKDNANLAITKHLLDELKLAFTHVDYNLDIARLLADYITVKQQQKTEYSIGHFKFEHANLSANKQIVIKEVLNSLEPLNQKLVEFCAFYVPYKLDEKKLRDFLNKNHEYNPPRFGIDNLNLQKALTGQNMELLKELQQFFIDENKTKFEKSVAGYTNSIMAQVYDYANQKDSEVTQQIRDTLVKNTNLYNELLFNYNYTYPDPAEIEKIYLYDNFALKAELWEEKLASSISINYLQQLTKNITLLLKDASMHESLRSYDLAIDLIHFNIFLPLLPEKVKYYYETIFSNTYKYNKELPNKIEDYIAKESINFSLDFLKKHNLYQPEILMIPYWLNNIQVEKFNYMHNFLQNNIQNLHEPLFHKYLYYFYLKQDKTAQAKEHNEKAMQQLEPESIEAKIINEYTTVYFPEIEKNGNPHSSMKIIANLNHYYAKHPDDLLPANFDNLLHKASINYLSLFNMATSLTLQILNYKNTAANHAAANSSILQDLLQASEIVSLTFKQNKIHLENFCPANKVFEDATCDLMRYYHYTAIYSNKLLMRDSANKNPTLDVGIKSSYSYPINEQLDDLANADIHIKNFASFYKAKNTESAGEIWKNTNSLLLGNKLNIIQVKKANGINYEEDCQSFATILPNSIPLNSDILNSYKQICDEYVNNGQPLTSENQPTTHDEL